MIYHNEIETALNAAEQFIMVESASALQSAGEEWMQCKTIGIDTEFLRERTYRAELGVVQLSDGNKVWLVDPLKTGPLQPLAALCEHSGTLKVLHAPSEDLAVLWHTTDSCPAPLFDTQIACAMLGQLLQMGYHKTVEWLLQLEIDKGETRSNWLKRPLRPAQLKYAALDVCLLPLMQRELLRRLQALNRTDWLKEDCVRLLRKARAPVEPDTIWKRINGAANLEPTALAILQQLAAWREREAANRNRARGFVVTDSALMAIANEQPIDNASLAQLGVLHPVAQQRFGTALVAIVTRALDEGLQLTRPAALNPAQRKMLVRMRSVVRRKAAELSVEPALLASRRALEALLLSAPDAPLPEHFSGWRQAVISDDLLALKAYSTG